MAVLRTARREITLKRTLWMAIVNVTPDSFSDGGRVDVVEHALSLLDAGADILDIGGESSRPGSDPISAEMEITRIRPVILEILERCAAQGREKPLLSVDTYHPETAAFALQNGVEILNDISGAENPEMVRVAVESGAAVCFMHMQGTPKNMQENPHYKDVLTEIFTYLARRRDALLTAGIPHEKLLADPGIGFGKTLEQNWTLIQNAHRFRKLGIPILVGHSRKGFLRPLLEQNPDWDRDDATHVVSRQLVSQGIEILRTHIKPILENV
ncbi:MAG: dihydropteroate synthase [Planctomycetia bacterium]|nr:dihydropteroate synthase [Planctomycetia bacterium]